MAAFLNPVDQGQQIALEKSVVFIGRHPDCDVVLTCSRKVSRRHCCLAQVNGKLVVRDLGSMNGVKINGKRIRVEAPLKIGDELSVGDVRYFLENGKPDIPESAEVVEAQDHQDSPGPASERAVDISQNVPVPLPESEIPDFSAQELDHVAEEAPEVPEEKVIQFDELELLDGDDEPELLELVEEPESEIIIIDDSGEIDDIGSAMEIIPDE